MSTYKNLIEKCVVETKNLIALIKSKNSKFRNVSETQLETAKNECIFPHVQFLPASIACHHCKFFIEKSCDKKRRAETQLLFFIQYLFNYERKIKCIERIELTNDEIKILIVSLCQFNNISIDAFYKMCIEHIDNPQLFNDEKIHSKLPEHIKPIAIKMCSVHSDYFKKRLNEIISEKQPAKKSSKRNKKTAKK